MGIQCRTASFPVFFFFCIIGYRHELHRLPFLVLGCLIAFTQDWLVWHGMEYIDLIYSVLPRRVPCLLARTGWLVWYDMAWYLWHGMEYMINFNIQCVVSARSL